MSSTSSLKEDTVAVLTRLKLIQLPQRCPSFSNAYHNLVGLRITAQRLTTLPESIGVLKLLVSLNIAGNKLASLPRSIGNLKRLMDLNVPWNCLSAVPEELANLTSLMRLAMHNNNLKVLPESVFTNLKNLGCLSVDNNPLTTLPRTILTLPSLRILSASNCDLSYLPFGNFQIKEVPDTFMTVLVDFSRNPKLTHIPYTMFKQCINSFMSRSPGVSLESQPIPVKHATVFCHTEPDAKWYFHFDPLVHVEIGSKAPSLKELCYRRLRSLKSTSQIWNHYMKLCLPKKLLSVFETSTPPYALCEFCSTAMIAYVCPLVFKLELELDDDEWVLEFGPLRMYQTVSSSPQILFFSMAFCSPSCKARFLSVNKSRPLTTNHDLKIIVRNEVRMKSFS